MLTTHRGSSHYHSAAQRLWERRQVSGFTDVSFELVRASASPRSKINQRTASPKPRPKPCLAALQGREGQQRFTSTPGWSNHHRYGDADVSVPRLPARPVRAASGSARRTREQCD
jgi:hypothetical protein